MAANTDFTAGQILTAAQQNNFPRGQMAYVESTTAAFPIGAEQVQLTTPSFTAVAGRRYKITYYEPAMANNSGGTPVNVMRIRLTNITGTILQSGSNAVVTTNGRISPCITRVVTLSAGATVLVATMASVGNVGICNRDADNIACLIVEDIGSA
jgi:hypothetical protein